MFGRRKPKNIGKVIESNPKIEDDDERDNDEDNEDEEDLENEKEETPTRKLVKDAPEKPLARISSAKIIGNGIYEYTLITNRLFGNIGEEFEI